MLNCRELAHRHASDYIDGQLGWRARLGVWWHLVRCDYCRRFIAQFRKVQTVLRNKPQNPPIDAPAEYAAEQQLAERLAKLYEQQKNEQ